jgi:RNA polymerase sigma-70 factor (ECF subfamily)
MTEPCVRGDAAAPARDPSEERHTAQSAAPPSFEQIYNTYFDFVFRSARRIGVPHAAVDDVVQETFLVVFRRLAEFEGRSSLKTWVYGILRLVARGHRRSEKRKQSADGAKASGHIDRIGSEAPGPQESAARAEAVNALYRLLDTLDEDAREVFVLAELEEMTAREIAEALGQNVNTVYTRLRAARADFESAVARHRARDRWRFR